MIDEKNYGTDNLDLNLSTERPYVRCNGNIVNLTKDHQVKINNIKWDLNSLTQFKTIYLNVCMECAGNSRTKLPYIVEGLQWNNRAVSNVSWGGVLLRDILNESPKNAVEIVCTSMDKEFTRSLPISVIYERPVMLAYLMNYHDIPSEHGGPIRLIVPGWYGMASVKWLDEIIFTDKPYEGLYQTQKYTYIDEKGIKKPVTTMLPKSLITSIQTQNPITIHGKAWSGNKILKVEVCIDDGWENAEIIERTGEYGWVCWEKKMILEGYHKIASRATDISGLCQPNEYSYNFYGYGNNAIQFIEFNLF